MDYILNFTVTLSETQLLVFIVVVYSLVYSSCMADIQEETHHHYGALTSSPLHSNQGMHLGMHLGPSTNSLSSGEHVLKILFADFVYLSGKKIEQAMKEPHDTKIADTLQVGGDEVFDQLLASLRSVAQFCLPSILTTLFKWHGVELGQSHGVEGTGERVWSLERRELVVNFLFCLAVIEVLKMLHLHPVPDPQILTVLNMAFSYFRCLDPPAPPGAPVSGGMGTGPSCSPPLLANVRKVADLFAEVLGVLSQACYLPVHRRFLSELQLHSHSPDVAINTIRGMSLLRVKMFPVEEVEAWFLFLHKCAEFLIEVRDPRIKNSMAYTLVEILIPVSIVIRLEVSLPPVKKFVDQLFGYSLELLSRKKDRYTVTIFPLITMLLSVSQSQFFVLNWHPFLSLCLNNLRSRNSKVARIALDCVYRLVWVYVVRIKCESNTQTYSRLKQVMDSLFPKGARGLVPKEGPLHYFVRIIHVVAKEKLDFVLREVIMELITCKGSKPAINPERMNIGFRAFFAIADSLERQEEEPPSPSPTIVLPSGTMTRTRRNFLTHTLTDNLARQIGLQQYLPGVKRALGQILHHLDNTVGKPLLATNTQSLKNPEEILSTERKAKVELLRTCVASVPRCAPEGYQTDELVEFLSRCTIHCDHDLNVFAFSALQSLQEHNPAIRPDIIKGVVSFILKEIPDSCPLILDMGIRMLTVLLSHWRDILSAPSPQDKLPVPSPAPADLLALRQVEALGLVLICANRQLTRKKTFELLKEALQLSVLIPGSAEEESVYSLIDKAGPELTQVYLSQLSQEERHSVRGVLINIEWLSERLAHKGVPEEAWTHCLASLFSSELLPAYCPSAVSLCWPFLSGRLLGLYSAMYPRFNASLPLPSVSGSAIRSKKFLDPQDVSLFQNYLLVSCSIVPGLSLSPSNPPVPLTRQPPTRESLTDSVSSQGSLCDSPPPSLEVVMTSHDLFHWVIPMIKSESIEMQRSVVYALGKIHPGAFISFLEELQPVLKEAGDKNETVRRRKRRSGMRIEVARILEMNAAQKCFTLSPLSGRGDLLLLLSSYLENTRLLLLLEAESDRMHKWKSTIKSHFASLVANLYWEIAEGQWNEEAWGLLCSYDLRSQLYTFFTSSCLLPRLTEGDSSPARKHPSTGEGEGTALGLLSLDAMSALACCGPLFDPAGLEPDGYLISWLTSILESPLVEVQQIACHTVQSLLRHNLDSHPLLNWVLGHCYTSPSQTASDLSFSALARVFSRVSYPCDPVSLLHLSLLKSASPNPQTREEAASLLHVLETRHLAKETLPPSVGSYVARRGEILVRHFSSHHPELTLPIFSDMVYRIDGASPPNQRSLLQLILPWLSNVELVDVLVLPLQDTLGPQQRTHSPDPKHLSSLKGTGWGCHQASELVLNNLLFLTIEHSLNFPLEVESLWGSLCGWSHNVGYIYSYLLQVIGLGLTPRMLHYAKSILCYLARTCPGSVIALLLRELSSVEIISGYLEPISPPPYFQVRPGKHYLLSTTLTQSDTLVFHNDTLLKSRYLSDPLGGMGRSVSPPPRSDSRSVSVYAPVPLSRSRSIGAGVITDPKGKLYENRALWRKSQGMEYSLDKLTNIFQSENPAKENPFDHRSGPLSPPKPPSRNSTVGTKSTWLSHSSVLGDEIPAWVKVWGNKTKPHPLPVPGGSVFYARLTKFLHLGVPGLPLHRCNFSLMLLTQVLVDQSEHPWERDLPLLLHVLFLGFDHLQPLVSEHCKHLLVSLLVLLANRQDPSLASQLLLLQQQLFSQSSLFEGTEPFHSEPLLVVSDPAQDILARSRLQRVQREIQSILATGTNGKSSSAFHLVARILSNDAYKPLWPKDDITPQNRQLASANQISSYIQQLLGILEELRFSEVREEWCHVALQWALICTSRHYACRSFQMCRALDIQLSPATTHQIVSRLAEAVADTSEDVQGYVMEILLTLSSGVDLLSRPLAATRPPKTPPATPHEEPVTPLGGKPRLKKSHKRSNSSGTIDTKPLTPDRNKPPSRPVSRLSNTSLSHSTSPVGQHVTITTPSESEDQLLQILLVSLCLLTSDFTHQYSMALKLFSSCLDGVSISSPPIERQLQAYIQSMLWDEYPGIQGLLLKGLTSSQLYEDSLRLIGRLTPYSSCPLFYPSPPLGLPRNILILLPVFVVNFSHQDELAKQFSQLIAQTCRQEARGEDSLESLGTLFHMYSLKSYHQPVHMWLASVSKFLNSAFPGHVQSLAGTLLDLLEEGVSLLQKPILQILGPFVKQMDQSHPNFPHFYKSLLRAVCVFLQTPLWEDCLQLLQDAVCDCSCLERPPTPVYNDQILHLPGPIMRFTLDISHTLQREFRTHEQCKQRNSLAPGWDRCVSPSNATQELLTRALAVMTSESHPSISRSSSVLFNSDMDRGMSAFYASYTSPSPLQSPTLKQGASPSEQGDEGSYVDVDLLLHKAFNFLDEEDFCDQDLTTVDSTVGLPWGVKLKKPLVDSESGLFPPNDPSESEECTHYKPSQPIIGRSLLDELQSWEQEQDPVDILVPGSQDEYPCVPVVPSADLPTGTDPSAPPVPPWGQERPSDVSLSREDDTSSHSVSATDSTEGADLSSREVTRAGSPDLSDSETGGYGDDSSCLLLPPTAHSIFLFVEREDVEDAWVNHTSDVSGDMCQAVHTFHLFNKLFRECRDGFVELTTEACNFLTEAHRGVASKLIVVIEIIMNDWECQHVFLDSKVITGLVSTQMDKFVFFLMEIKNDFIQYSTKRRQAQDSLDLLKRSFKSLHPSEGYTDSNTSLDISPSGKLSPQALLLCRSLYRMHFQFLVFLGSYSKLLGIVESWRYVDGVFDISDQLEPVRKQLTTFLSPESTPKCQGVVLEKKFMFGSPGKSRKLIGSLNTPELDRGLKLTRVERHKSHGTSQSMHQLEGEETGVKRNKSMGTKSFPLLVPRSPVKREATDIPMSPSRTARDFSCPLTASSLIAECLIAGLIQEAVQILNEARIRYPSDSLGTGPEDNMECLLLILSQSFLSERSGVLGLTGGSQALGEVHNNLMANNVNLYALLEHYED